MVARFIGEGKHRHELGQRSRVSVKKATSPYGLVAPVEDRQRLENQSQAEFDLPLCTESVHASAVAHTERLVVCPGGSID